MSRNIGLHVLDVEGDLLKLTLHGDFTLEDMKLFTDVAEEHRVRLGYLLILNDLKEAKSLSAAARRYSAERAKEAKLRGPVYAASAVYGASPLIRGLAALFYSMLRLMSGGDQTNYVAGTEAEARAFLNERRRYFWSLTKRQS
jgi:hypothetical protein